MRRKREMVHQNRFDVVRQLGESAVIWIDPAKVRHFAPRQTITPINRLSGYLGMPLPFLDRLSGRLPERFFFGSFILMDSDCHAVRPISQMKQYKLVADLLECLPDYSRSKWFRGHVETLRKGHTAGHKGEAFGNEQELCAFFENSVLPMMEQIRQSGYDAERYRVEGRCFIGPGGEIYKGLAGRHRFAIAALTGVRSFPLVVNGVHEQWFARHVGSSMDIDRLKAGIARAGELNA